MFVGHGAKGSSARGVSEARWSHLTGIADDDVGPVIGAKATDEDLRGVESKEEE